MQESSLSSRSPSKLKKKTSTFQFSKTQESGQYVTYNSTGMVKNVHFQIVLFKSKMLNDIMVDFMFYSKQPSDLINSYIFHIYVGHNQYIIFFLVQLQGLNQYKHCRYTSHALLKPSYTKNIIKVLPSFGSFQVTLLK